MKMTEKISFYEFVYLWFRLQNLKVPAHQKKMSTWLSDIWFSTQNRQALLMAFRNSGKSTIVGLFCAWVLYQDSSTRILVLAADHSLAKKMVRNVKKIIEQHLMTKHLKPQKLDQWASDQFTILREVELRDPSMLAKGLQANITGLRADLIICDDVEVPKNCDTPQKREDMREKLAELDYILTPNGMQLYIGTPHSFYTIYQIEIDDQKAEADAFLLDFQKLAIPIINSQSKSAWPQRFSLEKIASIRARSGENKFLSQMMLQPVNFIDSTLDPSRLVPYDGEIEVSFANGREILKIGDKKMIASSCWWDPAFGNKDKGDNSVVACIFVDEVGHYFLQDILYISVDDEGIDNIASKQCEKVVEFLQKNCLPSIRVEANGIGKFLPSILKQVLAKQNLKVAVLEEYSKQNKEQKIVQAFEILLAERALNVNKKIWQTPFVEEMREWTVMGSKKDDGLDAVAGCIISEPIRLQSFENKGLAKSWQGNGAQFSAVTKFEI